MLWTPDGVSQSVRRSHHFQPPRADQMSDSGCYCQHPAAHPNSRRGKCCARQQNSVVLQLIHLFISSWARRSFTAVPHGHGCGASWGRVPGRCGRHCDSLLDICSGQGWLYSQHRHSTHQTPCPFTTQDTAVLPVPVLSCKLKPTFCPFWQRFCLFFGTSSCQRYALVAAKAID